MMPSGGRLLSKAARQERLCSGYRVRGLGAHEGSGRAAGAATHALPAPPIALLHRRRLEVQAHLSGIGRKKKKKKKCRHGMLLGLADAGGKGR